MGTLIVFIAGILVAAAAASVLIHTQSGLQSKALKTGKDTTSEVGNNLLAQEVYATDGSAGNNIERIYERVRASAGSDYNRVEQSLITLSLSNTSADYSYNSSINCDTESTFADSSAGYGMKTLNNGKIFCFYSPRPIGEVEKVTIRIVPKKGSVTMVKVTTSDIIIDERITLFP